jgi:hypothetical protein
MDRDGVGGIGRGGVWESNVMATLSVVIGAIYNVTQLLASIIEYRKAISDFLSIIPCSNILLYVLVNPNEVKIESLHGHTL